MDSPASSTAVIDETPERALLTRVAVLGVVFAGACALVAASMMAGTAEGRLAAAASLVAVIGAFTWWFAPRAGYVVLLVDGAVTMVATSVALARGPLPWLLVAFWGGSALVLAAVLHLTADAGRTGTVTLVAVISLLVLSAVGMAQYVRSTWHDADRATLERVVLAVQSPAATGESWQRRVLPGPAGTWYCRWMVPVTPASGGRLIRAALLRQGWRVVSASGARLSATRGTERLTVDIASAPATGGGRNGQMALASVTATISSEPPAGYR